MRRLAAAATQPRGLGRVSLVGALFIAVIVTLAALDTNRGYHAALADSRRELDSHARIVAEQVTRSLQAVDVVLRHVAQQRRNDALPAPGSADLDNYLGEQVIGLVQTDGLGILDAAGEVRASSRPLPAGARTNFADTPFFQALRADVHSGLYVGTAARSRIDGLWAFALARRLDSRVGEFAGVIAARVRVDYFQQFYRDVQLDAGTSIALLHNDGTLLARHPPAEDMLGQRVTNADTIVAARGSAGDAPLRGISPIDGADRFGAVQAVPDYPLTVAVSRDTASALASWRGQALRTAARTLALAVLAALLLYLLSRQLARVQAARESLAASRERFALAVAGSDDGIWDWDYRTNQVFASARAREIVGVAPGPEMQTREEWFASLPFHPDDAPRRLAAIDAHVAGLTPAYEGEYRVRSADGGWRWVSVRGLCIRDAAGQPLRMAGSISDIDERKRAEEALRLSEQRFELSVAGSNAGIWDWDIDRDTLFVSARAQQLLGLEPGEPLRPRHDWGFAFEYHPDDAERATRSQQEYLDGSSGTTHWEVEARLRHAGSGQWRWYRDRGVALRDAGGRAYRMAGSMEDITLRKQAEADRDRLEGQLRQSQKLEAMGTLAGGIAHDFNNILAAILGYGEMAQKDAPEGSRLRRHIDAAMSAGMRAKSLVERILAFSRSGMGERAPVHVGSVADEALDVVAASLPAGITLQRSIACGDAAVVGDPTQIHQVVMNLCANAVQAMTVSRGTLSVDVDVLDLDAERMVTTNRLAPGRYARLVVRDSGSGIAPQVLERIFDPFFTTKAVGVGTGLGLSLVHGIVADLGGGIDVESRLGVGSVFTVWLPAPGRTVPAPAAADGPLPTGNGETILFVDDEQPLVQLGEELLAELGYEPIGFASSAAALAAFRAEPQRFDALLTDESMPELTGTELVRELRALNAELPVLMMSGYVSPALCARAKELGVVDLLAKPLRSGDIARALAAALKTPVAA